MKLLVIDGNSLLNRAFYGIKALSNSKGQYTNGIFGFLNMYLSLKKSIEPEAVAVAFDLKAPTFRHKMYSEYKAGRHATPDELLQQFPVLKELLTSLGISVIEKEGYEADDILGTLSNAAKNGDKCYIATGDRDSLQLVSENSTVMLMTTKMGHVEYTVETIKEEYGVTPKQMIEIKALQGDTSDNIPGVAGVGPKTAQELIASFGNIDYIYQNIEEIDIKPKLREKLISDKDKAYLSRELGTICLEVPLDTDYSSYKLGDGDRKKASEIFTELEMFSMLAKFDLEKSETKPVMKAEKINIKYENSSVNEVVDLLDNEAYFTCKYSDGEISDVYFAVGSKVYCVSSFDLSFKNSFADFLENDKISKTVFDVKSLYAYCFENSINIKNIAFDVMLGGYICDPSMKEYTPIKLAEKFNIDNAQCDNEDVLKCFYLKPLSEYILKRLKDDNQEKLYYEIELPLAEVLASMEYTGFLADRNDIEEYGRVLGKKTEELRNEIISQVGYEFNINSPKQLGEALFEKLSLPCKKKTKSGYSTNAEVLESIAYAHPVVPMILQYRTFSKLKSTYCDGLVKVIGSDGRIHSTFNQTETRTGRLSSTEPNLQNIPVRTEEGKEFRKFFKAPEGKLLIDADYSQIELRVLASMADDKNMIADFSEGKDFHSATASRVFNVPQEMVNSVLRSRAKAVNFGIVYGIGAFSLAKDIGVSRKEADKYIKDYLELYSGVRDYMNKAVENARTLGYSETLFARRRYLPELKEKNAIIRAAGERIAMNSPIQGTAADIIKIAMVKVYNRLKNEKLKSKLIMTVHDELIVEAPEEEVEQAKEILVEEMENACELKVKLFADAGVGKTWYLAKE